MKSLTSILLLASAGLLFSAASVTLPAPNLVNVSVLLEQAQLNYNSRVDSNKGKTAIDLWESALNEDPQNYEALWKLSRAYYWQGNHAPESEQLNLFTKGKNYGEEAVAFHPKGWEGHYWLGVSLGRFGETKGVLKSLFLIKPIKKEMETVLALNPDHAGGHHVLGVVYRKAPGKPISIGDKKKALDHAKKAVELDPQSLKYKIGLAEACLANDDKNKARELLEQVLAMPPNPQYGPESLEEKDLASKLLEELKKD